MIDLPENELAATFAYLFRRIDIAEFKQHVPDGFKKKRLIDRNGYMLLNCKLYAWAAYRAKYIDHTKVPKYKDFGIHSKEDARFLRRLDLSHIPKRYEARDLHRFMKEIEVVLGSPALAEMMGKFISKKLSFLMRPAYGLKRVDIEGTLKRDALYNVYRVYPYFDSTLHIMNVVKRAVKFSGQSLIKKHTTNKARRLTRHSDGSYSAVVVPLEFADQQVQEGSRSIVPELKELPLTKKGQRVFAMLAGQYDQGLSDFMGVANDHAATELPWPQYRAAVQRYTGISYQRLNKAFERLRSKYS